ncbi:maternal protein exuperantia-like [Temnothorax longispinosus]|uniref:maternal protein exuperantia-like n=1 Tax=Temnothorax longispinosus TaxID=300112 RepID=UPI003A997FA6
MASVQRREVIMYDADSGLNSVSGFIDESPYQADTSDHQGARIVIFDLETTGLSKSAEICQIAAVHEKEIFNVYIVPAGGMSSRAAEVTGLQVHGGEMFLNDQQVDTTPPQMAFKNFIAYLRSIGNSIILTAHNGFRFDAPLILRHMKKFGLLEEFQFVVMGFADTLHLFRNLLQNRKKE